MLTHSMLSYFFRLRTFLRLSLIVITCALEPFVVMTYASGDRLVISLPIQLRNVYLFNTIAIGYDY